MGGSTHYIITLCFILATFNTSDDYPAGYYIVFVCVYLYMTLFLPTLVHILHKAYTTSKFASNSLVELKVSIQTLMIIKV